MKEQLSAKFKAQLFLDPAENEWEGEMHGALQKGPGYSKQIILVRAEFNYGMADNAHAHPHRHVVCPAGDGFEAGNYVRVSHIAAGNSFIICSVLKHIMGTLRNGF